MKANIEYNLLLQNNGYALIETKGNYIVAANYNPEAPFGQQWTNGTYYTFFGNTEVKPKMLAAALECYRLRTEGGYISRRGWKNWQQSSKMACLNVVKRKNVMISSMMNVI